MYIHADGGLPSRLLWNFGRRLATFGRLLPPWNRRGSGRLRRVYIGGCGRLRDGRLLGGGGLPNRNR